MYAKGAEPAIDALDLGIKDGEFMVLVGPSGLGKTIALRMLAGFEPLDGGRIEIAGRDVSDVQSKDRTSPWCSRTMRCIQARPSRRTWGSRCRCSTCPSRNATPGIREAARILTTRIRHATTASQIPCSDGHLACSATLTAKIYDNPSDSIT